MAGQPPDASPATDPYPCHSLNNSHLNTLVFEGSFGDLPSGSGLYRRARKVGGGRVACSVTVLGPAAGLRCDFRNLPMKQ